ncbi:UNVERIFIED_CONTAM: hypothetical protein FKN15_045416 [Acipenser sinensis]
MHHNSLQTSPSPAFSKVMNELPKGNGGSNHLEMSCIPPEQFNTCKFAKSNQCWLPMVTLHYKR